MAYPTTEGNNSLTPAWVPPITIGRIPEFGSGYNYLDGHLSADILKKYGFKTPSLFGEQSTNAPAVPSAVAPTVPAMPTVSGYAANLPFGKSTMPTSLYDMGNYPQYAGLSAAAKADKWNSDIAPNRGLALQGMVGEDGKRIAPTWGNYGSYLMDNPKGFWDNYGGAIKDFGGAVVSGINAYGSYKNMNAQRSAYDAQTRAINFNTDAARKDLNRKISLSASRLGKLQGYTQDQQSEYIKKYSVE